MSPTPKFVFEIEISFSGFRIRNCTKLREKISINTDSYQHMGRLLLQVIMLDFFLKYLFIRTRTELDVSYRDCTKFHEQIGVDT